MQQIEISRNLNSDWILLLLGYFLKLLCVSNCCIWKCLSVCQLIELFWNHKINIFLGQTVVTWGWGVWKIYFSQADENNPQCELWRAITTGVQEDYLPEHHQGDEGAGGRSEEVEHSTEQKWQHHVGRSAAVVWQHRQPQQQHLPYLQGESVNKLSTC